MLHRCVQCLTLVHSAGGHSHLEQPSAAMSWMEPCTQAWLRQGSCAVLKLAACAFGRNWAKHWLFATSFRKLSSMGAVCQHGHGAHPVMRGPRGDGTFHSRETAEYPKALAEAFAAHINPLLSAGREDCKLSDILHHIPCKGLDSPPWALHDGAGRNSQADWSSPCRAHILRPLRSQLLSFCAKVDRPRRLLGRCAAPSKEPLFTMAEVSQARDLVFSALNIAVDPSIWEVREHQPLSLSALHRLASNVADEDIHLFKSLKDGVPTGFQNDIPDSGSFWPNDRETINNIPLSLHLQNWRSAEVDLATTKALDWR